MTVEALESRMALAGGLGLSVITTAAEIASLAASSPGVSEWVGKADATQEGAGGNTAVDTSTHSASGDGTALVAFHSGSQSGGASHASSTSLSDRGTSAHLATHADGNSSSSNGAVLAVPMVAGVNLDGVIPRYESGAGNGGQVSTSGPTSDPEEGGVDGGAGSPSGGGQVSAAGPAPTDPTGQIFQTEVDQEDLDAGLLDPLAWTVTDEEPFGEGVESVNEEEQLNLVGGPGVAGPSTLMDQPDEIAIGMMSYRSAAEIRGDAFVLFQPGDGPFEELRPWMPMGMREDSIAAGASWRGLLSGSKVREEAAGNDREHIAELSPFAESSKLALAATLWSAPAQAQTEANSANTTNSAGPERAVESETSGSSWKVFVMGLDRAMERSYGEVRRELSVEPGVQGSRPGGAALRVEWRGAIVPTAVRAERGSCSGGPEGGGGAEDAGGGDSFVPAVLQLGEFLFENLLNPVFGHENGGNGNSQ